MYMLKGLGGLLLSLACSGLSAVPNVDVLSQSFSPELTRLVAALLASAEGGPLGNVRQLSVALADRAFSELDTTSLMVDTLVRHCLFLGWQRGDLFWLEGGHTLGRCSASVHRDCRGWGSVSMFTSSLALFGTRI